VYKRQLYYRINTVQLTLPPLRDRRGDIPLLLEHFIERFNGLTGKRVSGVSGEAMQALMRYRWPGNVRELEHAIEHAFVLVKDPIIGLQHLPEELAAVGQGALAPGPAPEAGPAILLDAERQTIEAVLRRHGWNKVAASRELGVSRTTLWRKIRKLGIAPV